MQNDLLPYDQLEVVYKNTQEKIDAYYAEAQGLLDILKNKNKPFLDDLITKEYSFEDKYTDIQGTFAIAGSSIDANAIKIWQINLFYLFQKMRIQEIAKLQTTQIAQI